MRVLLASAEMSITCNENGQGCFLLKYCVIVVRCQLHGLH